MNLSMQLRHLAEAERHIARGAHHIGEQEIRIAELDCRGHDSALASAVLEAFHVTQALHLAHRDHILRELDI